MKCNNIEERKATFKQIISNSTSYLQKITLLRKLQVLINTSPLNSKALLDCFCAQKWGLLTFMGEAGNVPWRAKVLAVLKIPMTFIINEKYQERNEIGRRNSLSDLTKPFTLGKEKLEYFISNDYLIRVVVELMNSSEKKTEALSILRDLCYLAQLSGKEELYIILADKMMQASAFVQVFKYLERLKKVTGVEIICFVKIFEIAAICQHGIELIFKHFDMVSSILQESVPLSSLPDIAESIVLTLVHMLFSKQDTERVADLVVFSNIFPWLVDYFNDVVGQRLKGRRSAYFLCGLFVNLACNVKSEKVHIRLLENGILGILTQILCVFHNIWPSNDALLGLTSYASNAVSNFWVYRQLIKYNIRDAMKEYAAATNASDAKKSAEQVLTLLSISDDAHKDLAQLIDKTSISPAA
eukprot:TRINITY_DN9583_c0_g2_i2.p1 TRINITY_DN9583_c0_g2~~TRINITY_DN9583_c0_g2_i2.p1  ORF type:complete len:426 (+),score=52.22 TRINITY_DN9583_c0_g2_i2:41-1279(+)